jgi:hypothetical protein
MKFSLIAICLCGLLCSFANAARPVSYLCVTEMSTGFLGEEKTGKWRVVRFNERKYIVFEPKPGSAELYVRQIGSANPIAQCKFAPEWGGGALHCSGREEFWMLDGYEKSAIHGDVSTWVLEYGAGNGHRWHTISRHRHLFRVVILRIRSVLRNRRRYC